MSKTKEVKTSVGKWIIKKPNAKTRNDALIISEATKAGYSPTLFMVSLIPNCIQQRPDGFDSTVPIVQVLDSLDPDDWDWLVIGMNALLLNEEEKTEEGESTSDKKKE